MSIKFIVESRAIQLSVFDRLIQKVVIRKSLLQRKVWDLELPPIGELNGSEIESHAEATVNAFSLFLSNSTPSPGPSGG